LGFGAWGMAPKPKPPTPNPQSPIPNPQSPIIDEEYYFKKINLKNFLINEIYKTLKNIIFYFNICFKKR